MQEESTRPVIIYLVCRLPDAQEIRLFLDHGLTVIYMHRTLQIVIAQYKALGLQLNLSMLEHSASINRTKLFPLTLC